MKHDHHPLRAALTSRHAMLLLALVVIAIAFQLITLSRGTANPFLSARSLSTIFMQASVIGVLACGMTFIIILGHIDLSVGSALAFLGGLAAWLMGQRAADLDPALAGMVPTGLGWPGWLALLVVLLLGMLIWGAMGLLQVATGMPAFIITLGAMMGFRGLALLIVKRERVIPDGSIIDLIGTGFLHISLGWLVLAGLIGVGIWQMLQARRQQAPTWYLAWVPAGLLAAVVLFLQLPHEGVLGSARGLAYVTCLWAVSAVIMAWLARGTVFGRHLYAAGGNQEAAMLCGIRVRRINIVAFILMGLLTALAALMYLGQQGTAESSAGQLYELDAIAACVIGGVSLQGGKGSISGAALGAIIMQALTAGLYQCNVESGYQYIIKAAVLVLVVAIDHALRRDG